MSVGNVLSFVIPVKDEQDTINSLAMQIIEQVGNLGKSYKSEIVFVDDGSKDNSWTVMCQLAKEYNDSIVALRLRRNFGKAVALEAGFQRTTGDIIFTMDADLQDNPVEIPRFLEALDSGYDMVSGWKRRRFDPVHKKIPSRFFNKITALVTGLKLHDFNCGFKAYRCDVARSVQLYGELHRYIPVLAHDLGYRIGEIEVEHLPRKHGVSKYGLERYIRGFVDLITVLATTRWLNKPGHLFGGIGAISGLIGGSMLIYLTVLWFLGYRPIGDRPLLLFGVLFCITSIQMISLGVIAEFFIKTKNPRNVNEVISETSDITENNSNKSIHIQ